MGKGRRDLVQRDEEIVRFGDDQQDVELNKLTPFAGLGFSCQDNHWDLAGFGVGLSSLQHGEPIYRPLSEFPFSFVPLSIFHCWAVRKRPCG